MFMKFLFLVFFSYCVQISYQVDEYCYATDENRNVLFSYLTSYSNLRSSFPASFDTPENCIPIYALAFIKYGVSYMSQQEIERAKKLLEVRNQIIAKNPKGLCEQDFANLRDLTPQWDENRADDLAAPGRIEQVELARHLKDRIKPLLDSNSKDLYDFQTAAIKQSGESAIAFANELLGSAEDGIAESELLKEISKNRVNTVAAEMGSFIRSELIQNMLKEINARLGFTDEPLTVDIILSMYEVCGYENAWGINHSPAFCAAFLPDHLKAIEYIFDLKNYYEVGYGNTQNENSRVLVIKEILKKISDAADGKFTKKASFYFSNGVPISLALVKLGLYRDEQPLKSDNYEAMKESRNWRSFKTDGFSSNIVTVLYSCSNNEDKKVGFYHNENLLKVPFCQDKFCSLTQLKDEFKTIFENEPRPENENKKDDSERKPEENDDANKSPPDSEKKKDDNTPPNPGEKETENKPQPEAENKKDGTPSKPEEKVAENKPQPEAENKKGGTPFTPEEKDGSNKPQLDGEKKKGDNNLGPKSESKNSGVVSILFNSSVICIICVLWVSRQVFN